MAREQLGAAPSINAHTATKTYVDSRFSGAATATVATVENTSATSNSDLATTTDQVTITVGASGLVLVSISAIANTNLANTYAYVSFMASGSNTFIPDGSREAVTGATSGISICATHLFAGLNPGSTTFKMKYQTNGGSTTFGHRNITVIPL